MRARFAGTKPDQRLRIFRNAHYATFACRRPIRMSLLCQIDMTLPRVFREVSGVTVRLMSDKELARLDRDRPALVARVRAARDGVRPTLIAGPFIALGTYCLPGALGWP